MNLRMETQIDRIYLFYPRQKKPWVLFSTEALRSTLITLTLLYTYGFENVIDLDLVKKPRTFFHIVRSFPFSIKDVKKSGKIWNV